MSFALQNWVILEKILNSKASYISFHKCINKVRTVTPLNPPYILSYANGILTRLRYIAFSHNRGIVKKDIALHCAIVELGVLFLRRII